MGEPIYILADTPNSSSQIVQALVELIKPVHTITKLDSFWWRLPTILYNSGFRF
jgi:hypothetical protein